jgi:methionine-rich copper-binding protein CopC
LRFNVRVDATRSRLTLLATGTTEQPLTLKIEKGGAAETLTTQAVGLHPGTYSIRWQVLASDGHITRGEVPFTVRSS